MRKSVFLLVAISVCVYTVASYDSAHDIEHDAYFANPSTKQSYSKKAVCYETLGCFSAGPPFYHFPNRPVSFAPFRNISAQFLLYTPKNPHVPQVLDSSEESLKTSTLDPRLETKILIHGYTVKLSPTDVRFALKDELLNYAPMNVIIVDWTASNHYPYYQAVANARVVGAQVAKMINYHVKNRNLNPYYVHLIGHSLGGQMCGWVGERVPGLGRITGLDPAGPWFQYAPPEVRLDTTDAEFVDVIHTNGGNTIIGGMGIFQPIGHLDFYPNGGKFQPGCSFGSTMRTNSEMNGAVAELVFDSCAHERANAYFLNSIRKCQFKGVNCGSYHDFQTGKCTSNNSLVAEMGYHADKVPTKDGKTSFYLRTLRNEPYCENSM